MDAAIGALGASDEVFKARYSSFFDDLAGDRSDFAFTVLAELTDRLTTEQYQSIQSLIQRKLAQGGTLPASPGIAYFALAVLSKAPKAFEHNRPAVKTIVNNALTADFTARYINNSYDPTYYSAARAVYATFFATDWLDILRCIPPIVASNQPKKNEVSQLGFITTFGKKQKASVVEYLWELFEQIVKVSYKSSTKLNIDALFNAVEKTFKLKIDSLSSLALNVLRTVAACTGAMFEIYLPRLYSMLNTVELNPNVLYPFLTNLVLDFGPVIHFSRAFPDLVEQFTESLSLTSEKRNDMYVIGRDKISRFAERFDTTAIEAPAELHALVVAILENAPLSIPAGSVLKIQTFVCRRLLENPNSILPQDLALLNALLAGCKENVPSVVSIARHVYFRQSVVSNTDLTPYVRIGRAYCDIATQARTVARYTDIEPLAFEPDTAQLSSFVLQSAPQAVESTPAAPEKASEAKSQPTENPPVSKDAPVTLNSTTAWLAEHIAVTPSTPVAAAALTPNPASTIPTLPSLAPKKSPVKNATPVAVLPKVVSAKDVAAPVATKAAVENAANGVSSNVVNASAIKDFTTPASTTVTSTESAKPVATKASAHNAEVAASKATVSKGPTPSTPKTATPATAPTPTLPKKSTPAPPSNETNTPKPSQNKVPQKPAPTPSNDSDDDIQFILEVKRNDRGKKRSMPARVKPGSPPPKKAAPLEPDDEPYTLKKLNVSDMLQDLIQ